MGLCRPQLEKSCLVVVKEEEVDEEEEDEEEEEEEEEDIYVVHLKENGNQLLTGMGMFWMPKNGSKMNRNMSGGI